jgi:hypothetical protein
MKPGMVHPNTYALINAWRRIETNQPHASDPRADDSAQLISHLFILEFRDDGTWPIQSAGSSLPDLLGRSPVNQDFRSFWSGPDQKMAEALLSAIRIEGEPGLIHARAETVMGRRVDVEIGLAPFTRQSAHSRRHRVLGLYQVLSGSEALDSAPVFRHRIVSITPPDHSRNRPRLHLVAAH